MKLKKPPKISVITPSFNQGKYLERTILSVINQKYPNTEYIIIDGGSTDSSVKIIKKYKKYLTYWVSEKDQGQADALNKGFSKATGEILCWLNSDDIHFPWTLSLVSQFFQEYKSLQWITGQAVSINTEDVIVRTGIQTGKVKNLIERGFYHGKALGFIPQEGTFWKRNLWKKTGSFIDNKTYAMDFALWKRFANHAPLVTVEAPLGAFRINPQQKTQNMSKYYGEIHPLLNFVPKQITLPVRVLHPLLLRRMSDRIKYSEKKFGWVYEKGFFSK